MKIISWEISSLIRLIINHCCAKLKKLIRLIKSLHSYHYKFTIQKVRIKDSPAYTEKKINRLI